MDRAKHAQRDAAQGCHRVQHACHAAVGAVSCHSPLGYLQPSTTPSFTTHLLWRSSCLGFGLGAAAPLLPLLLLLLLLRPRFACCKTLLHRALP